MSSHRLLSLGPTVAKLSELSRLTYIVEMYCNSFMDAIIMIDRVMLRGVSEKREQKNSARTERCDSHPSDYCDESRRACPFWRGGRRLLPSAKSWPGRTHKAAIQRAFALHCHLNSFHFLQSWSLDSLQRNSPPLRVPSARRRRYRRRRHPRDRRTKRRLLQLHRCNFGHPHHQWTLLQ